MQPASRPAILNSFEGANYKSPAVDDRRKKMKGRSRTGKMSLISSWDSLPYLTSLNLIFNLFRPSRCSRNASKPVISLAKRSEINHQVSIKGFFSNDKQNDSIARTRHIRATTKRLQTRILISRIDLFIWDWLTNWSGPLFEQCNFRSRSLHAYKRSCRSYI